MTRGQRADLEPLLGRIGGWLPLHARPFLPTFSRASLRRVGFSGCPQQQREWESGSRLSVNCEWGYYALGRKNKQRIDSFVLFCCLQAPGEVFWGNPVCELRFLFSRTQNPPESTLY